MFTSPAHTSKVLTTPIPPALPLDWQLFPAVPGRSKSCSLPVLSRGPSGRHVTTGWRVLCSTLSLARWGPIHWTDTFRK